jgi:carbon monoxide dehydrogenase subunit G
MLISQSFEVKQPIDAVWKFFDDIPQVAASIPGANLSKEVTKDKYEGGVVVSAGPVKLEFDGVAEVKRPWRCLGTSNRILESDSRRNQG